MLSIINNQTNWYKEKQKELENIRTNILKESAYGRYLLALRRERAFKQAKNITLMANIIAANFNPNHFERPEVKKVNEILASLENLISSEVEFRRKQVYPNAGYISKNIINQPKENNEFIFNHKKQ